MMTQKQDKKQKRLVITYMTSSVLFGVTGIWSAITMLRYMMYNTVIDWTPFVIGGISIIAALGAFMAMLSNSIE